MPTKNDPIAVADSKVAVVIAMRNAGKSWDDIATQTQWAWQKCRTVYASYQMGVNMGIGKNKKPAPVEQAEEQAKVAFTPQVVVAPMDISAPLPRAKELILSEHEIDNQIVRTTASYFYDNAYCDYFALAETRLEIEPLPANFHQRRTFVLDGIEAIRLRDFLNTHIPVTGKDAGK